MVAVAECGGWMQTVQQRKRVRRKGRRLQLPRKRRVLDLGEERGGGESWLETTLLANREVQVWVRTWVGVSRLVSR